MSTFLNNTIRSILTATVIVAGFAASADAAELRKKTNSGHGQAIGGLTTGTSKGGGSGNLPDLVPMQNFSGNNGLPQTGYCGPWNGGDPSLHIRVRNFGGVPAGVSQLTVQFSSGHIDNVNVPALAPGASALVTVPVPDAAWSAQYHGNVQFNMTANSTNSVAESNLSNNTSSSQCIGPAT